MTKQTRDYHYYDSTRSICPECFELIDAKVILKNGAAYLQKVCRNHTPSLRYEVLLESSEEYYKSIRNYLKPGEIPRKFGTRPDLGCPLDCGLCSDHEQHSCLTLLEVTDRCNLECPTCFTFSSPRSGSHRTLEEIDFMLDSLIEQEGEPDVLQISGGEPTLHPEFFAILDRVKARPIGHVMINTNGIRLANEPEFLERLASYRPGIEIYLQFDSLKNDVLSTIRGARLKETRERLLARLNELNFSTTLVVTLQRGRNDEEIGSIIQYALKQRCVRGVTFQPTQFAGRTTNSNFAEHKMTISEIRSKISEQSGVFSEQDLLPVPCNPDALAMGYALKLGEQAVPLTRYIDPKVFLDQSVRNTIVYEQWIKKMGLNSAVSLDAMAELNRIFSTGSSVESATESLKSLLCCLPKIDAPSLSYKNVFRIIIMKFMDAHDFDVRSVRRSCVHILSRDGKIIPFETMNLYYRPEYRARLEAARAPFRRLPKEP